jgi:zinc transporter, ZIP family
MSFAETAALGAIAGFTIFLGLPIGRAEGLSQRARVGLSMLSAGILAFLFMDVGAEGLGIIETHLEAFKAHDASLWPVVGLFALLSAGFLVGVGGIATVQRLLGGSKSDPPPLAGAESATAMSSAELADHRRAFQTIDRKALRTAMVIAVAIGLHNFAEGLAIGVSAQAGEIGLATVLIIGFALHNSTEGFGIVGPLSGVRPSWRWLGLAGLVAGGPTFLGAMVGSQVILRPRGRRDPLRHRRDLGGRAPPGPRRAWALHARDRLPVGHRDGSGRRVRRRLTRDVALLRALCGSRRQRSAGGGDPTPQGR